LPHDLLLDASDIAEHLLVQNFVSIPAPIIGKHAWLDCGGLDPALWYTTDWDLYLKLIRRGPTVYRASPSTAFRVHGSSLTVSGSRDLLNFEQQMQIVLNRHCDLVSQSRLPQIKRRANASITVNCALAKASSGSATALVRAVAAVLKLGPAQT